ncbi:MAG TPA: J domain-containing protein, partial [Allosphingosinicella sp.]|nr:J domain-containing protein [Allosphingosinicella sp.]
QGARLSKLSTAELQGLVAEFRGSRRRGEPRAAPRLSRPTKHIPNREPAARPAVIDRGRGLPRARACPGGSLEEVRAAYRRLMKRVHPDLGGSSALAALLNAAKEILDPS